MKKKSKKSKLSRWIQKVFVIPSYEMELDKKQKEIDELNMEKNYLQSLVYKYKNKVVSLRNKEVDKNVKNNSKREE